MDQDTFKEIIKLQLNDLGVIPTEGHFTIAKNIYDQTMTMPDIRLIIDSQILLDKILNSKDIIIGHLINDNNEKNDLTDNNNTNSYINNNNINNILTNNNNIGGNINNNDKSDNSDDSDTDDYENDDIIKNNTVDTDDEMPELVYENDIENLEEINEEYEELDYQILSTTFTDIKKVLDDNEIEKIKLIMINSSNNDELKNNDRECLTCYDPYVKTDLVRILPCGHHFHRLCIDHQLKTETYLCPTCQQPTGEPIYLNQ